MKLGLNRFLHSSRARRREVTGVDVGSSGTKVVRLRTGEQGPMLMAAALLPPMKPPPPATTPEKRNRSALSLPGALCSRYVAVAISPPDATAKMLVVPRAADKMEGFGFAELLGLPNNDTHRIGIEIQSSARGETTVLAAALPESAATWSLNLFPTASSAPCSLELSGLAALNAIAYSLRNKPEENAVMAIDVGAQTSTFGVFMRNELALLRQFKIGAGMVWSRVAETLGMDEETARDVLTDNVIDASDAIRGAFDPLVRQLTLGRDFVARHRNCRIGGIYLSGGMLSTPFWRQHLATMLGLEANDWNPLTILPAAPGAVPPALENTSGCFAAAMGAALAALEAP